MDRYELNVKMEQIKRLARQKEYAAASKIADTIDFYRIKENKSLQLLADVYEASGKYSQAKEILIEAYARTTVGRQLAYRLVRLCIKSGNISEAEDFYDDFVNAAPKDNSKYILQYELAAAKGKPLEERIKILETYLSDDMDERWAFELAKLYHKSGQKDKCVRQCDDVILWFNDGKYVDRAMELKMLYKPLTKLQQEKYEKRWRAKAPSNVNADEIKVKEYDAANKYNTVNIQNALKESMDIIMNEDDMYARRPKKDSKERKKEELEKTKVVFTDEVVNSLLSHTIKDVTVPKKYNTVPLSPMLDIDSDGQIEMNIEEEPVDDQIEGQITIGELLDSYEKREAKLREQAQGHSTGQEAVMQDDTEEQEKETQEAVSEEILAEVSATEDIISQEYEKEESPDLLSKEDLSEEDLSEEKLNEENLNEENLNEESLNEENLNVENLNEESLSEESLNEENIYEESLEEENFDENSEPEEIEDDFLDEDFTDDEISERLSGGEDTDSQINLEEKVMTVTTDISDIQMALAEASGAFNTSYYSRPKEDTEASQNEIPENVSSDEEEGISEEIKAVSEDEASELTKGVQFEEAEDTFAATKDISKETEYIFAATKDISKEIKDISAQEAAYDTPEEIKDTSAEAAYNTSEEIKDIPAEEAYDTPEEIKDIPVEEAYDTPEEIKDISAETAYDTSEEIKDISAEAKDDISEEIKAVSEAAKAVPLEKEENVSEKTYKSEEASGEAAVGKAEKARGENDENEDMSKQVSSNDVKELIKDFVSKYSGVQGLDRQLLTVLQEVLINHNTNLIVMGEVKSGKTALAIDLVKIINKIQQVRGRKIAKINGEVLNEGNVSEYFEKLAGMDLIIEKAGVLKSAVAARVIEETEKDEDLRIIVLEDEKTNMESFLNENSQVNSLFKGRVVVKQNKVKDWALVAKKYADSQGYEIDEMGILALHARIDDLYAVSLLIGKNQVEEIVDNAIKRSKNRKLGKILKIFGREREKILKEQDFA